MKYNPPKVEEYPETDESTAALKRKRNSRDLEYLSTTQKGAPETENQEQDQPPAKAAKATSASAPAEEDDFDEEDETGEFGSDVSDVAPGEDEEQEEEVDEVDEDEDVEPEEAENDAAVPDEEEEDGQEQEQGQEQEAPSGANKRRRSSAQNAIDQLGRAPLDGTSIGKQPLTASADTVLAMVIDAMLKSRPISHDLSQQAINKIIEAGYHDIDKLAESSWEERTAVLRDGGYNRYREQGAKNLGDLAHFVDEKYRT